MAGKGNTFETEVLSLFFRSANITGLATADATITTLYVALHTADPAEAGVQTSSECDYTGYARVGLLRTSGGSQWTVANGVCNPSVDIVFPAGGTATVPDLVTFFSVGTASTGSGKIMYFGPVSPSLNVSEAVTPRLTTATQITED